MDSSSHTYVDSTHNNMGTTHNDHNDHDHDHDYDDYNCPNHDHHRPKPSDTAATGTSMSSSGIIGIVAASIVVVGFITTTLWMKRRQRLRSKRPFDNDDPFGSLPIQSNYIPPEDVGPEMQMLSHGQNPYHGHHHQHHHGDQPHGYDDSQGQAQSPHYLNQEVYHGYDAGYGHDGGGYGVDQGHYGGDQGHYGGDQGHYGNDHGGYGNDPSGYGGDQGGYNNHFNGGQDTLTHHQAHDGGAGTSGQTTNVHADPNSGGGGGLDGGAGGNSFNGGGAHSGGGPGGQGVDFGHGGQNYGPTGYTDGTTGGMDQHQHLLDPNDGGGGGHDGGWSSGIQGVTPTGSLPQPGALPTAIHPYAIPPVVPQGMLKAKDHKRISMADYNSGPIIVHPAYPPPPPRTPSPASPTQSYPSTVHTTNDEHQSFLADGYSPQDKQRLLSRIESIGSSSTAGGAGGGGGGGGGASSSSGGGVASQSYSDPYHMSSGPLTYLTSTSSTGGGPSTPSSSSPYSAPVSAALPPLPQHVTRDYPVTATGVHYGATDTGLNVEPRRISRPPQDMGEGSSDPVSSKPVSASPPAIPKRPSSNITATAALGLGSGGGGGGFKFSSGGNHHGNQKRDPQGSIPNNPQAIRENQQTYTE
ncbi:hypothetical protein DFQ26_008164 [Actinomortierella ambigua]|nr:hypothetical protein DFQ26_008164 [Actinomortierella ambigua]